MNLAEVEVSAAGLGRNLFDHGILGEVGNTPLFLLPSLYPKSVANLFVKAEFLNPGGSLKDRTAKSIVRDAWLAGRLKVGGTVVESSSGNMAIGLAQTCSLLGLRFVAVVDPNINQQTLKILRAYGCEVEQVTEAHPEEGYLGARILKVAEILKSDPTAFWPNQYANPANPAAHRETMREIHEQLQRAPDYLFLATSTCGTLMGCATYIREHDLRTKIIAVDALGSKIFGSGTCTRLIPGHGAGRPSQHLDPELVDQVIHVGDQDCVEGCHHLLSSEAILCGGSSGALVSALGKTLHSLAKDSTVVLLLADRGERYLDTIYSPDWVAQNFPDFKART